MKIIDEKVELEDVSEMKVDPMEKPMIELMEQIKLPMLKEEFIEEALLDSQLILKDHSD